MALFVSQLLLLAPAAPRPMGRRKRPDWPHASREAWGTVHPQLDLHGLTADEALRRTEAWLRSRQEDGTRTVVVITGRGVHSTGPPVLRGEIEHLLNVLRSTLVAGFSPAAGGGGFQVELRRRTARPPAKRPRVDAVPADPELRRRAEQSLWELGVHPTPALLEVEMRRLRQENEA